SLLIWPDLPIPVRVPLHDAAVAGASGTGKFGPSQPRAPRAEELRVRVVDAVRPSLLERRLRRAWRWADIRQGSSRLRRTVHKLVKAVNPGKTREQRPQEPPDHEPLDYV